MWPRPAASPPQGNAALQNLFFRRGHTETDVVECAAKRATAVLAFSSLRLQMRYGERRYTNTAPRGSPFAGAAPTMRTRRSSPRPCSTWPAVCALCPLGQSRAPEMGASANRSPTDMAAGGTVFSNTKRRSISSRSCAVASCLRRVRPRSPAMAASMAPAPLPANSVVLKFSDRREPRACSCHQRRAMPFFRGVVLQRRGEE